MNDMRDKREAVEARPWRPEDGPQPHATVYPPGSASQLRIRTGGSWRHASVLMRLDWANGHVSYQVEVVLVEDGVPGTFIRSFWWDPAVMRLPAPVLGALGEGPRRP